MSTVIKTSTNQKPLVPKLRFKEFVGEWENFFLGKIALKVGSGSTPKGGLNVYQNSGIPFIRSQNIFNDKLYLDDTHISCEIHEKMKGSTVLSNDILLNITGGSIGRSCVVPKNFKEGNVNQHVCIIRLKPKYEPNFFQLILISDIGKKLIYEGMTGSGREGLNFQSIRLFRFNLPQLPEQQKIASFLTAVDQKIQQLNKKQKLLEQYKKAVMQQLFSGKLRFKDENGNAYPDWEEKKMRDIMAVRNDQAPKSKEYPLMAFIKHVGVAPKGDRYNREFLVNDGDRKKYKKTEYGDFIYSSNNLDTGSIGLNRHGAACISPVYSIFKIKELCDYRFISRFLVRTSFINKMLRFRQGVVYGQWKIHESAVLTIKENIPSLEEQQKIANYLSAIDQKIENVQEQITQAQSFKKGLLQQLFV